MKSSRGSAIKLPRACKSRRTAMGLEIYYSNLRRPRKPLPSALWHARNGRPVVALRCTEILGSMYIGHLRDFFPLGIESATLDLDLIKAAFSAYPRAIPGV